MSFFPKSYISSDPATSFTPLFRLLDDFDTYSRGGHHHRTRTLKTFQPKFDVKELPESYELHGELPGIEQKDVEIEFTDRQTLTIRGRTERTYTAGSPPAGSIEAQKAAGAIEGSHKATVGDEYKNVESSKSKNTEVSKETEEADNAEESGVKYWVSERSVGEFARTFNFPEGVDQDAVRASMKNGILSIVVPKAKKHESRKITITS